tara:strand:+ start:1121 stop:2290 length:1170 start_codon:yes stop_codon:yes gene_type:complete
MENFDITTLTPVSDAEFDALSKGEEFKTEVVDDDKAKPTKDPVKIGSLELTQLSDTEFDDLYKQAELDKGDTTKVDTTKVDDKTAITVDADADLNKMVAKLLKEDLEFLPGLNLEEYDGTVDGLKSALRKEFTEWQESYKQEAFDPRIKYLQDNLEDGVPFDELINIKSNQIRLDNITPDSLDEEGSENLQRVILTQHYKETTSFSESKIKKEVDKKIELGEVDDVKEALEELKKIEADKEVQLKDATKKQQAEWKKESEKQLADFKAMVYSTKELIPGVELSKKEQDAIYDSVLKPVKVDGNGQPVYRLQEVLMRDPKNTAHLNWYLEVTKDLTDFSYFDKVYKTKATKEFDKVINKSTPVGTSIKPEIINGFNDREALRNAFKNKNK